jgi:RNA polymerase sigma-70 factor (ECF subfamily)
VGKNVKVPPQKDDSTDEELILSFLRTRSNKVFELIYDRHSSFVYRKCLYLTESEQDAQDLAQGIWTKVYFALDGFRFESKFSTWLRSITVNRCINHLKTKDQLKFSDNVEENKKVALPKINNHLDVTKLLSRLSKFTRMVLTLKYVEGYTYEEIAETTGLGVSAVKMRISRAKKELLGYTPLINSVSSSEKDQR